VGFNDANHIPMLLKAELAVGSLKASIDDYKNVKYPLKFSKDNYFLNLMPVNFTGIFIFNVIPNTVVLL
jgi:hypothetical protein